MQLEAYRSLPQFSPSASRSVDQELLRRASTGDAEAFDTLFSRHRDGLQGFLYRKLGSHEEAEDAVTLTFCNAWRARASFRGTASGKAWLYQIATRVALDVLRRRRRHPAEQELDAKEPDQISVLDDNPVDPEELLLERESTLSTQRAVSQAIDRLSTDERRMLHLFYFEEQNYEEISETLGVSRSQVRGRLHRIRQRLRHDLTARQRWQPLDCGLRIADCGLSAA
jgi:RNA polymerase sigma-70 factor (ECF subfamily)